MTTAERSTSVQRNSQRMGVHLPGRGVDEARLSRRTSVTSRLAIALTGGQGLFWDLGSGRRELPSGDGSGEPRCPH